MTEHLTAEETDLLARHELKGAARVRVLVHLESCADCRRRFRKPTRDELLKRLEDSDETHKSIKLKAKHKNKE